MEKRTMLRVKRNFERFHWGDCARFAVFAIFALWVGGFPKLAVAQQLGQKTFPSAEEASQALFVAVQDDDRQALMEIFGPAGKDIMSSGDAAEDANGRHQFVQKYQEMHRLGKEPDGTTTLYIGAENWPLPIPLVNQGGTWSFDAEAGKQEILFRRIGQNELMAMQVCHELVDAEKAYYAKPRGDAAVKQYTSDLSAMKAATMVCTGGAPAMNPRAPSARCWPRPAATILRSNEAPDRSRSTATITAC
jgi:hypothetical protein